VLSRRKTKLKKNIVEERGVSGSKMKREHESKNLKAHRMMRGILEPFVVPIVVKALPTVLQKVGQTTIIPHMTFPQER
jgi:hypothetical protein